MCFVYNIFYTIISRLLLVCIVLAIIDTGLHEVQNNITENGSEFHFVKGLIPNTRTSASLVICNDLNVRKPPRFGKREAFIDRYGNPNKCIDRKRRLFVRPNSNLRIQYAKPWFVLMDPYKGVPVDLDSKQIVIDAKLSPNNQIDSSPLLEMLKKQQQFTKNIDLDKNDSSDNSDGLLS